MKRAVNIVLAVLISVILISSVAFYAYRVELVWLVVKNDLTQKAPGSNPKLRIDRAFDQVWIRLRRGAISKETLLQQLFGLSQKLERTQYLTDEELDRLLQTLEMSTAPAEK